MGRIRHERIVSDPDIILTWDERADHQGHPDHGRADPGNLGEGMTVADRLEGYPHLTPADVRATLSFAADYLRTGYLRNRGRV